MNIFSIIIVIALLADYVIGLLVDFLNLRTLTQPLPTEFEGVVTPEAYAKSQAYTRTRTLFGLIAETFNLACVAIFWFSGGFNWLDTLVRQLHLSAVWTGDIYIGALLTARGILSLPFNIYSTFVIEERFGFNKTTVRTFVTDLLKGIVLGVLIGGPLLTGILAFFEFAGPLAWLYCWGVAAGVMLFIQFVAPTWIMPLFNKFVPLEEGDLRQAIFAYARSVAFTLDNIFVMDGSRRSSKSNAFFAGFGRNKRIALYDTLVHSHTTGELVAVLAHEIGHYKRKHVTKGLVVGLLHMGLMFFLLSFFISAQGLFDAFFMTSPSVYAGLIFFGLLYTPVEFLLSLGSNIISRKHEYEADRWAAETTRKPGELIRALKKLSVDNLSHLNPHPLYVFMHYSHPPVLQRLRALRTFPES